MKKSVLLFLCLFLGSVWQIGAQSASNTLNTPFVDVQVRGINGNQEGALAIQVILLLAVIALSPSVLLLLTSFLRVAIVLDFIKRALGLQQVPPNQIIMGISLFLTLFVMWPTFSEVYQQAFKPYSKGEITVQETFSRAEKPFRYFMFKQINDSADGRKNIELFLTLTGRHEQPKVLADIPTYVLIPAFILNELRIAFKIAILLFLPFLIIDMVVSSVLMSMGMMMLPPAMISTPFKLMLFVLVDGWSLITRNVIEGFL